MLTDLERDSELVADLMMDLADTWREIEASELTPRSLGRIEQTLVQLHRTADALRDLRVAMDRLVRSARQVA